MNDLVSIIMPSYNTANYIAESIESVVNQTYDNWELIIVDDCSTDNTDEIVKKYLNDKRIKYLKNDKNSGAAVSRNYALREAKGKWIAFLDSDDLWEITKLNEQIEFMKNNNYYFSYTSYQEINENGFELNRYVSGPKKITKLGMYLYCWPGCLTVMYDRDAIGLIQINDIKKNNDYAIWIEICKNQNCYLYNKVLSKYRRRKGSISDNDLMLMISWHYKLWRNAIEKNAFCSIIYTCINLFFGLIKKIIFIKKIRR